MTAGTRRGWSHSVGASRPPAAPGRSRHRLPLQTSAAGALHDLERIIRERRRTLPEDSYTSHLFREGKSRIRKKLGEEAIEVITAASAAEVAGEAADLLYHLLVLLVAEEVSLAQVLEVLAARVR